MNLAASLQPLQSKLFDRNDHWIKKVLLVITGVIILALSSQLSIPLKPIPLTFQSSAVILLGLIYGPSLASTTVISYLAAGSLGAPVFAGFSGGVSVLMGPASGYLVGFLPAAVISGYLAECGFAKYFITSYLAALLGVIVIFALGVMILSSFIGWHNAVSFGIKPFIYTEALKLVIVSLLAPQFWKKIK
jgi:biotin transporter BioY